MYILATDLGDSVLDALRTVLFSLCSLIYYLIVFCFDIFEKFGDLRLFEGQTVISDIYTRIGLILGLFMIFRLTFSAIQYMIDPDKMTDTKSGLGNIIKKVLIVIVLLGSTRFLFDAAYKLQSELIESDVVGKIILSKQSTKGASSGTDLAWYTFSQFYKPNSILEDEISDTSTTETDYILCKEFLGKAEGTGTSTIVNEFYTNHTFNAANYCLNKRTDEKYSSDNSIEKSQQYVIDFSGWTSLLVGGILLWTIFVYTIQVGIRVFQLAYLELIAPIPIMTYLMPNGDEKLKKWGQQCLTTFLDFFIRLAIFDFIILVSNVLVELDTQNTLTNHFQMGESNILVNGYIIVILIIALFMFAKKVPELLKEIFPSAGGAASLGFGIKSPKEVWGDMKSTPILGMGAKAIGYAGNNLVKKPIENKIAEKAELKKVKKQANKDIHERKALENKGRDLYNTHGGTLPDTVFKSKEYRASYNRVSEAKGAARDAEDNLHSADLAYQAAYNSGDATAIARTKAAREAALKENRAAQARLEATKQDHENIKKIYAEDAKIENAHKYYKDLHPNGEPQPPRPMSLEEAARISTDNNASDEDQQRAAEVLDEARRQRNSNNNNNNNN